MATDEARFATLEANAAATAAGISDIKTYLTRRSDQHLEVMQSLAVIKSKQEDFSKYIDECDKERSDLDTRLVVTETNQRNQARNATAIASTLALLFTGAVEWFRK